MTDYIDFYTESELDDLFSDIYEIEGVRKIKELSRQLRTFFNYKAEVIQFRFRSNVPSNHDPNKSCSNNTFYTQKQKIESLSHEFISLLKSIKRDDSTLEQEIYYLHFDKNPIRLNKLSNVTEKISSLIHSFSEGSIHDHPKFLKFIVILSKNIIFVKKCLNAEFYAFYDELEINYGNLGKELRDLIGEVSGMKNASSTKLREERLLS
ncbi:MAG: hypothetical protein ACTSWH_11165 [Promethearchaeota archaeon]